MKSFIKNRRTLIVLSMFAIAAILAILANSTTIAAASAPSHSVKAQQSVIHKALVVSSQAHCKALGRNIESGANVGCVKQQEQPTVLVPTWQSDGENVSIPFKPTSAWTLRYSCQPTQNMTVLVTDVSRTTQTFPIIDMNTICDSQTHENVYHYLPEAAITISTDKPATLTVLQVR